MIKNSLISVITVVLNGEKNILRTLKSVKSQKNVKIEHIIVDGKSNDKTLQVVKKNIIKKNIIISEKDKNLYDAINKGIKIAKGKYIYLLHSGDIFCDNFVLYNKLKKLETNKLDFVFSNLFYYDFKNQKITRKMQYGFFKYYFFKFGLQPPHCSFLIKKAMIKKINYYSINYKIAGDFEFLIKLFKQSNIKFRYMNINSIYQNIGGISDTSLIKKREVLREICVILEKNKIFYIKLFFILKLIFRFKEKFFWYKSKKQIS